MQDTPVRRFSSPSIPFWKELKANRPEPGITLK